MPGKKKKFYITTSIAYANAPPHIGFALELVQADVLARYHRSLGEDVFFLTGTDEHGAKVAKRAIESSKNPKDFVDEISEKFKRLTKVLNISNDDFIRTTDKIGHWPVVEKVWRVLKENNDIYKKNYKGFYCVGCEAFITKKDLINGKCKIHQIKIEEINEENYFFRLSKYSSRIQKIIGSGKIKITPETRENELLSFIKQGLEDISFSRPRKDLEWGIPVPGDNTQTIYVWADALSNYISALGYPAGPKFKKYWPADVHCIGKDILKFHALIWPAMILSLDLPLPQKILVHGFINVDGQKMSKSLGNVVDPFSLVKKYGADAVRYYLLREISPTQDGDFTYEKFEQRYNSDLAGGIGNLFSRTIALAVKSNVKQTKATTKMQKAVSIAKKDCEKYLKSFKFNDSLKSVWKLISFCDRYINQEKPWELNKNAKQVVSDSLFALQNIAILLSPFLPETSQKIEWLIKQKKQEALFPRVVS